MRGWFYLLLAVMLTACGSGEESSLTTDEPAGLLLNQSHGDEGSAWGAEACDACHALNVIHKNTTEKIRNMAVDKGYRSCTGCHGSNGTSAERECLICHNSADLPGAPYLDGNHSHAFSEGQSGGLNDGDCLVCHHYSDMNGRFDNNLDLTLFPDAYGQPTKYRSQADFCLRCHNRDHQQAGYEIQGDSYSDPLIALEDDYRFIDYHGWRDGSGVGTYHGVRPDYRYPQLVACSDCHALHGTVNDKLIIDNSRKGAASLGEEQFHGGSYPVIVSEQGDYSQLCVLCHEMELLVDDGGLDTGNGLSGVHLVGEDCRPCHTHGEASQVGL
jgi:hypothetical protein